ncbi:helix-turn-helix domain-containing protein, partial [Aquaticitalea lipolytica]|uniref:helix-turn-helix domain-containing protein n=1 Tax=Aquaticitalea lipolytica TaxID=1247562 RepID=UPI001E4BD6B1
FPIITLVMFLINPFLKININSYDIVIFLFVFHIFVISYIGYTNQELLINPIELLKRSASNLNNIDTDELKMRLFDIMNNDKIFLDKELTLNILSKKLNITTHQLSEYLNHQRKESFNDFINSYRVDHAKELLLRSENSIYTLEGISSNSGFKSLATFHRNFKKQTGTSPLKWLDEETQSH